MSVTDVQVPGAGRRAAARKRRRQRQRRLVALGVALVLLAAAAVAVLLDRSAPDAEPAPPAAQGRTQQTLLLQVRSVDGSGALASALLAADAPSGSGAVVLVPPRVIVDVPGAGSVAFGQALGPGAGTDTGADGAAGRPAAPADALSDLLGVTVDGSWVLESGALTQLVDALGGITATVDVPVLQDGSVVLPQGEQRLDGARALLLLGYLDEGEPEQARLARVQEVLDGVLGALPEDQAAVAGLVDQLAPASASTLATPQIAALLLDLEAPDRPLQYDSLPVVPIDPGGGVTAFRLDAAAAGALVDRLLAQSVREGARQTGNRVLVLNGVGPGVGEAARGKLVAADLVFVGARNNERFGVQTTTVLVPEATPAGQALGERVAAALGVPAVVQQSDLGTVADAVVVIGADFQP